MKYQGEHRDSTLPTHPASSRLRPLRCLAPGVPLGLIPHAPLFLQASPLPTRVTTRFVRPLPIRFALVLPPTRPPSPHPPFFSRRSRSSSLHSWSPPPLRYPPRFAAPLASLPPPPPACPPTFFSLRSPTLRPSSYAGYELTVIESHQSGKADTSGTAKEMVKYFNALRGGAAFDVEEINKLREKALQVRATLCTIHTIHTRYTHDTLYTIHYTHCTHTIHGTRVH
jgi:hypothetical protein